MKHMVGRVMRDFRDGQLAFTSDEVGALVREIEGFHHREGGRIAFHEDVKIMSNPHQQNSAAWNRWRLGWLNAQRQSTK